MALTQAQAVPSATYRVQLHGKFTFADLEKQVPYLRELGITDCYCSPVLFSTPGSTHGYDVNDYRKLDPELGGEPAFENLSRALGEHQMGLLLDFVPNHMGISGPFNPWWEDVLESGRNSPYAGFFDVHWNSRMPQSEQRILVPILEDHYGAVLEQGKLKLHFRRRGLRVAYGDVHFPLSPPTYARILARLASDPSCPAEFKPRLDSLVESFRSLKRIRNPDNPAAIETYASRLAAAKKEFAALVESAPRIRSQLDAILENLNGVAGQPRSFDALDALLEEQHYRLARWKTGAHETNYRRFFAVDTLIGLRMENPEVFHESHLLLALLLREKKVTGLRIDHIDGLWDPLRYLERLQTLARPEPERADAKPLYVLVEKILALDETLPSEWPVHGTTGYDFMTQLGQLLTDHSSEAKFNALYAEFTGQAARYEEIVYLNKRLVLDELFANAVNILASSLHGYISSDRRWRDLTLHEVTIAVREIMAALSVYRTYRRMGENASSADVRAIERACEAALRRNGRLDPQPFIFVRDVVVGRLPGPDATPEYAARLNDWVLNFQQYTGAVMAKAVEDTSFYVYNRLVALNEVGGDPAVFGCSVDAFHQANAERFRREPLTLLATSTHDTKWSEDVRARLYALAEIPDEWEAWLHEWRALNHVHKTEVDGRLAPDATEEYRLYQAMLGAWPLDQSTPSDEFKNRIREYHRKAVNEAKVNTTWLHPNDRWLEAGDRFIDALLTPATGAAFLAHFVPRAARLARLGVVNALSQVVLKSTSPGVPDFYQGNEIWDFSLVDPDNRRPVDFASRYALLRSLPERYPRELLRDWKDGGIKLFFTQRLLTYRRDHRSLFEAGAYHPLRVTGTYADRIVAFARVLREKFVVVVVPRLAAKLGSPPLGLLWDNTTVELDLGSDCRWRDLFTGQEFSSAPQLAVAELFRELPAAVLTAENEVRG